MIQSEIYNIIQNRIHNTWWYIFLREWKCGITLIGAFIDNAFISGSLDNAVIAYSHPLVTTQNSLATAPRPWRCRSLLARMYSWTRVFRESRSRSARSRADAFRGSTDRDDREKFSLSRFRNAPIETFRRPCVIAIACSAQPNWLAIE